MKILITGPTKVGKSTFIHQVTQGNCLNLDRSGTTIAMDFGILQKRGVKIHLFGTPGLERFRLVRKVLAQGADGVIFMIDASNLNVHKIRTIWQEITQFLSNVPCIVAVNKKDIVPSLNIIDLRNKLKFIIGIPTIPISALTGENTKQVLNLLILIIITMNPLLTKLKAYQNKTSVFQEISEELRLSEKDTKEYLRWLDRHSLVKVDWENQVISLPKLVIEALDAPGKVLEI